MIPDSSQKFLFDYSDASITNVYKANVKNNDGYIEVPLKSPGRSPNAIYLPKNTKYKVEKLYIFKNIHNIENQQYDGELIIEHTPITNDSGNKIYSCFLLKTDSTSNTDNNIIDKIITRDFESTQTVNMNNLINTKSECITNKKNTVFIFTKSILVKSTFTDFDKNVKNILFDKYVSNDYIDIIAEDVTESSKEGFQEGLSDQSYLECTPTGASNETIEMYTTPIGETVNNDKSKMEIMSTTINFVVFMIIVGISASVSPFLYKNFVIDMIKKDMYNQNPEQEGSLKTVDVFLTFFLVTIPIIVCSVGINLDNSSLTSYGIIFFVFIILSISVIICLKITNPGDYALKMDGNTNESFNGVFVMKFVDFITNNMIDILKIYFIWACLLVAFSLGMFYTQGFSTNDIMNSKIRDFILSMGFIYGLFITVYIAYIFSNKGEL